MPTDCTDTCPERHCRVCRKQHVTVDGRGTDRTCGTCLAATREHLGEIVRMVAALPAEAAVKGPDSEAMALLAPAADPDQWDARTTFDLAGKTIPADCDAHDLDQLHAWLDKAAHDVHPGWLIGNWDLLWRDTLDHERPVDDTLVGAAAYLNEHLTRMAHFEHLSFSEFARDLYRCRRNLERVLRDGPQIERGAPCWHCSANMVREYGTTSAGDHWRCPRESCGYTVDDFRYRGWVEQDYIENAESLTAADMERRFGPAASATKVRVWGSRGLVRKTGYNYDRLLTYSVDDVLARITPATDSDDAETPEDGDTAPGRARDVG